MTHDPKTPVVVSYSGGTSSTWTVYAYLRGLLPRPEHFAVSFADTGLEHDWTYEAAERMREICRKEGVDFLDAARSELLGEHLVAVNRDEKTRADHPPVYIAKGGGARGQAEHRCTREFKVAPMRRAVSAWLKENGLPKRVVKAIGFAADEVGRAVRAEGRQVKDGIQWEKLTFPGIKLQAKRGQQKLDLQRWTGRPAPEFSMCTICPKKSPARWRATPAAQLQKVYEIDEAIRDMSRVGLTEGEAYLCDRLIPVETLIKKGDPQPELPGLESFCDGGACFL